MNDKPNLFDAFYKGTGPITYNDVPFVVVTEDDGDCPDVRAYDLRVQTPGDNGRILVDGVNLHFKPGDRVIFTGASGTGKTTVVKALMNSWDFGRGLVVMPKNVKTMLFSQQAYVPNANLRTILNSATEGREVFDDRALRHALTNVGLDRLVEQIPGQKIEILIDQMIENIPGNGSADDVYNALSSHVIDVIPSMFNSVQYVPEKQIQYLHDSLRSGLAARNFDISDSAVDDMAKKLLNDIDGALLAPLEKRLGLFAVDLANRKQGRVYSYTPKKIDYFSWAFRKVLDKKMAAYMGNDDTDDNYREIRLNKYQAGRLVDFMTARTDEEMRKLSSTTTLTRSFNAVSWPLSLQMVRKKAFSAVNEIIQATTYFMDKQVMTGDTMALSGGERQKLMMAIAKLHKPDILFLDEITAALDKETGAALYKEMLDSLPANTIVISIAHNTHIMPYHTLHAHLENKGVTVRRIDQTKPAPEFTPSL